MRGSNKNCENRVSRLEVIAILAKVVNVALTGPLKILETIVRLETHPLAREISEISIYDYVVKG